MTDFDEFLRKRNEERAAEARNTDVLFADQGKEWQRLKDELRRITDGKRLGTDPFEWSPYPAPYTDFLKLKDVAVVFATTPIGALAPGPYRIVFARRPLRANEVWVDDEPISAVNWVLTLEPVGSVLHWNAKEPGLRLPTSDFAAKIAEHLVEYFEAYIAALKSKYPGVRF